MDSDSDNLYDPSDIVPGTDQPRAGNAEVKMDDVDEGEEEGEEIEEDDSDDVITVPGPRSVLANQASGRYQLHHRPERRAQKRGTAVSD